MAKLLFSKILLNSYSPDYYVSIIGSNKSFNLYLPKNLIREQDLDSKLIEFLSGSVRNVVGFRILSNVTVGETNKGTTRLVKKKPLGNSLVGIGLILKASGIPIKRYKRMKLENHHDPTYGKIWYFKIPSVGGDN